MHMTNEDRRYLAELGREQDRLLAEHAEWTARREAAGAAPVQKSDDGGGLVYKTIEDAMPAPAEPDWSAWERWLKGHLAILRQEMIKGIAEGVMMLIHRERDALDRKLAGLRAENAELKGKVDTLLQLLGQKKLWTPP